MTGRQSHDDAGEREFLRYVFHLLSQPLTALQCSLELGLLNSGEVRDYRQCIECALENSDRLRSRLGLVRELADGCEQPAATDHTDLVPVLRDAIEQLQPLIAERGEIPAVEEAVIEVRGRHEPVLRGFLYAIEFLLQNSDDSGAGGLAVSIEQQPELVIVRLSLPAMADEGRADAFTRSLQMTIARRIFEAAGGSLCWKERNHRCECEILLRGANALRRPPAAAPSKKTVAATIGSSGPIAQIS